MNTSKQTAFSIQLLLLRSIFAFTLTNAEAVSACDLMAIGSLTFDYDEIAQVNVK